VEPTPSAVFDVEQAVLDVRRRRTVSAALLDKGTFPWYKRDNGGGVKSLILLVLCALPDNPFLAPLPQYCITKLAKVLAPVNSGEGAETG
jgi:hypothetical protein